MQAITADDYQQITTVFDPVISLTGTIAVVARRPAGERTYDTTLLVGNLDEKLRPFLAGDWNVSQPAWSPSGDRLAFVSARGSDRPQLWVAPTDGGEARRVTDVCGGVGSITWSPDGTAIAFIQEPKPHEMEAGHDLERGPDYEDTTPDPRVVSDLVYRLEAGGRPARTWEHYYDGARPHIYCVDLATDDIHRVTGQDEGESHASPTWGDDDSLHYLRVQGEVDATEYDIVRYDRSDGEWTTVTETSIRPNTVPILSAASDGRVAYPHDDPTVECMPQTEIHVFDPDDGTVTVPTEPLDRKPSYASTLEWDETETHLYFMTDDVGTRTVRRVRGDATEPPAVAFEGGDINGYSVGGDRIVVTQSHWDHPGDVFVGSVVDEGQADETRVTRLNEGYLEEREVLEPEEFWYPNGEGDDIQGWLLTPPEFNPEETYPVVVQVHGGPSPVMWTTSGTMWHEWQLLAQEGYVVFWANPRGSTGYGSEFMRAVRRDYGGPFYRDTMAGVDYLLEKYDCLDEENMFVTGGSYGGYMSAWAVSQTDRFRAASAQRGVYDYRTAFGTRSQPGLREWYYGSKMWEEPDIFLDHSPVSHAHEVETPLLLIQSEHDYNCPRADAEMLYRYLHKNGVDTQLVLYPREGHELSRSGEPAHVVDRLDRIVGWFDRYSTTQ